MSGAEREKLAQEIAELIASDISDRDGIGNALDEIDDDIREEMLDAWADLILEKLDEAPA